MENAFLLKVFVLCVYIFVIVFIDNYFVIHN